MRHLALITVLLAGIAPAMAQSPASPYAGQQHHAIKSLSPEDTRDLAEGRGMGLAKAAELNGYPGPLHVLELASELRLSDAQRTATEALFQRMKTDAVRLGEAILRAERDLDRLFAERRIDGAALKAATMRVASLQGELRAAHLAAHLEQTALMTPDQVAEYAKRRGYDPAPATGSHGVPRHRH